MVEVGNWIEQGAVLMCGEYAVTTAGGVSKTWWRRPFFESVLVGVFEDQDFAMLAAGVHRKGREDQREEVRSKLGF